MYELKAKLYENYLHIIVNNRTIKKIDLSQSQHGSFQIKIKGELEEVTWEVREVKRSLVFCVLPINLFQTNKITIATK